MTSFIWRLDLGCGINVTLKGVLEIPEAKDFTVSIIVSTRDGSKIADADVVMIDGTNSSSYKNWRKDWKL